MAQLLEGNIVFGGTFPNKDSEAYSSLGHYLLDRLQTFGERVLLIHGNTDQKYTGKQIYDAVVRCAYVLQHLGVQRGDVVAVFSENSFDMVTVMFAAFVVNTIVAPLNATYTDREAEHIFSLIKPKILFCSKLTYDRITQSPKLQDIRSKVISFHNAYVKLMKDPRIKSLPHYPISKENRHDDVVAIMCSSGTCGLPKAVLVTQRNILSTLDAQMTVFAECSTTVIVIPPMFHLYGCGMLILNIVVGNTNIFFSSFVESQFLKCIEKNRVPYAMVVPPLVVLLAKHPLVERYNLSSLKILYCGGASLDEGVCELAKKRIGIQHIFQGYGLSESTFSLTFQTEQFCKPGSVGRLSEGVYAKVEDDTGRTLGPNQRGELCFKAPWVTKGYLNNKEATRELLRGGWLHTGDIGYFDDNLEFYCVDRLKELIKYKAFQVAPAELEDLLLTHPKIKDAAVVGKPDEMAGELPTAFVLKQPQAELSAEEVVAFVAERVSSPKRLRGGVVFVDDIPKNSTGKIMRRLLRDTLRREAEAKSKL